MTLAAELAGAFVAGLACALAAVGLLARWMIRHPEVLMKRAMGRAVAKQRQQANDS